MANTSLLPLAADQLPFFQEVQWKVARQTADTGVGAAFAPFLLQA